MKLILSVILIGMGLLTSSCSMHTNPIDRKLLNIRNPMGKPTSEFGSMEVSEAAHLFGGQSFSAFLWPERPLTPMETLSKEVSQMSRAIDRLTKEYREHDARMIREQTLWNTWRCNKETDKPKTQPEILDCEKIILEIGAQAACACIVGNQPLLSAKNAENLKERMELGAKIVAMVENDEDPETNWLMGADEDPQYRMGSVLKLRKPNNDQNFEVYLRLKHFGARNATYKTPAMQKPPVQDCNTQGSCVHKCTDGLELFITYTGALTCVTPDKNENEGKILGAAYDASKRSLFFVVFEKVNGQYTGNLYFFKMERGFVPEGSPDLVRFKGDLAKYNSSGKRFAIGAAKFDGEWLEEKKGAE